MTQRKICENTGEYGSLKTRILVHLCSVYHVSYILCSIDTMFLSAFVPSSFNDYRAIQNQTEILFYSVTDTIWDKIEILP